MAERYAAAQPQDDGAAPKNPAAAPRRGAGGETSLDGLLNFRASPADGAIGEREVHPMTKLVTGGVEFRFYRPNVTGVNVAGSFNGWDTAAHPMRRLADGWWSAMLRLPAGEYQFRYLADGQWHTDYASFGVQRSRNQWNSVLFVPEAPATLAMRKAA
jgi:hypothetical protein